MEQGSKEWLDMRKNHIGASDAPIIMGVCKFKMNDGRVKTPRLLCQEKLGMLDGSIDNVATRFGTAMEEPARQAYQKLVGDEFAADVVFHPDLKYMMASLDGINITQDRAVEIKNCSAEDHAAAKKGKVPVHYYPQVMHQLEILFRLYNITQIDYFSYHKGEGVIVTLPRDEDYIDDMLKKESKFWNCVENLEEPDLIEADFIERDDSWKECASRLWELKKEKRALETEEKALESMLKDYSEGLNSRAGGFRYTRSVIPGRVDYQAIPELLKVDLDSYRKKPSERWSLREEK
jgi:putative phage-type endonuclease